MACYFYSVAPKSQNSSNTAAAITNMFQQEVAHNQQFQSMTVNINLLHILELFSAKED